MVKRIVWSHRAIKDRQQILEYWIARNKSKSYSKKLNGLINNNIKLLSSHPNIGRITDVASIRVKVVKDYHLVYKVESATLYILAIWDCRQNPEKKPY